MDADLSEDEGGLDGVPEAARAFAVWLGEAEATLAAFAEWLVLDGYKSYPVEDLELIRDVLTGAGS